MLIMALIKWNEFEFVIWFFKMMWNHFFRDFGPLSGSFRMLSLAFYSHFRWWFVERHRAQVCDNTEHGDWDVPKIEKNQQSLWYHYLANGLIIQIQSAFIVTLIHSLSHTYTHSFSHFELSNSNNRSRNLVFAQFEWKIFVSIHVT